MFLILRHSPGKHCKHRPYHLFKSTPFAMTALKTIFYLHYWGWSGGARSWVNFQCRGVLLIWIIVGQGPIALAVGAGGVVWAFFSRLSFLFLFSLSLEDGLI